MKKYTPLLFVLVTVILLGLASAVTSRVSMHVDANNRDRNIAGMKKEKENTLDVLVVGDSESFTAMSPMVLYKEQGIASFVAGQSGQRLMESYYRVKEGFARQKLKLVILETDTIYKPLDKLEAEKLELMEQGSNIFSVFRYHDLWKKLLEPHDQPDIYKGFQIREQVAAVDEQLEETYMEENVEENLVPKVSDRYIKKIRSLCNKHDAKLLLVSAPSPKNFTYAMYKGLKKYSKETGIPYLDFNGKIKEIKLDWNKDSLDKGDHVNVLGAEKISSYLGTYLKENYDLPDRRNDSAYADWTKLADTYYATVKKDMGSGE